MTPQDLDRADPLAGKRAAFHLPDGVIYLDGNSLGALPHGVRARVAEVVSAQWGNRLIRGWNECGWMDLPARVGDRIGRLIGAPPGSVTAADSTSINVTKALTAALGLRPERRVILSDTGNFPTDLYIAQGVAAMTGTTLRTVAPEDVAAAIDDRTAVLMLTEVDYRTGRKHDMAALTAKAHASGALTVWDLAHSAGAFAVDVGAARADFAVGCGYKYFNGGPGAPAFIYVAPSLQNAVTPVFSGWMGHAAPFAFEPDYRPADGVARMTVGTPSVLGLAALDAALDVWDDVDMGLVTAKSAALGDLFIAALERGRPELRLASPRAAAHRGSQVSFHCENGYAVMQALIAEGVIGDFRAPDLIRFGFTPLYTRYTDVAEAAAILLRVLDEGLWRRPAYQVKARVT
ncbi:MAG: kynureninase [Hyphomonadaceae bacterium]|nr:kynureninase [Hyphomonadaceae bacterium]